MQIRPRLGIMVFPRLNCNRNSPPARSWPKAEAMAAGWRGRFLGYCCRAGAAGAIEAGAINFADEWNPKMGGAEIATAPK
jgi:hypothetical protein